MRKSIALAVMGVVLALPAVTPAGATETLGTILFGRPLEPGVTLIFLRPSHRNDDRVPSIYRYPTAATLARAQDQVASDADVRATLARRNIRPGNVIGVQTAANGGKVVYVR